METKTKTETQIITPKFESIAEGSNGSSTLRMSANISHSCADTTVSSGDDSLLDQSSMDSEGLPKFLKPVKITWDENNLTENERIKAELNPAPIDEPKTPYHAPLTEEPDDEDTSGGAGLNACLLLPR